MGKLKSVEIKKEIEVFSELEIEPLDRLYELVAELLREGVSAPEIKDIVDEAIREAGARK